MAIQVSLHFKEPFDKTFTFTDGLELGRSFIPDPSISKRQGIKVDLFFFPFLLSSSS